MVCINIESAQIRLDCLFVVALLGVNCAEMVVCKNIIGVHVDGVFKAVDCVFVVAHCLVCKTKVVGNLRICSVGGESLFKNGNGLLVAFEAAINSTHCDVRFCIVLIQFSDTLVNRQGLVVTAAFHVKFAQFV